MNRLGLATLLLLGLVAVGCTAPVGVDPASAPAVDTSTPAPASPEPVALEGCGDWDLSDAWGPADVASDAQRYEGWTGPLSGWPPRMAILDTGESVGNVASAQARVEESIKVPQGAPPSGRLLDVVLSETDAGHIVRQMFGTSPIEPKMTLTDFYTAGGVQVSQQPTTGTTAQRVRETVGPEDATIIGVGPHDAALIHGAPNEAGIRKWNIFWSDGKSDYSVVGGVEAEVVVAFGRSIMCGL